MDAYAFEWRKETVTCHRAHMLYNILDTQSSAMMMKLKLMMTKQYAQTNIHTHRDRIVYEGL